MRAQGPGSQEDRAWRRLTAGLRAEYAPDWEAMEREWEGMKRKMPDLGLTATTALPRWTAVARERQWKEAQRAMPQATGPSWSRLTAGLLAGQPIQVPWLRRT